MNHTKKNTSGHTPLIFLIVFLIIAALNLYSEGNLDTFFLIAGIAIVLALVVLISKLIASRKASSAKGNAGAHEPRVSAGLEQSDDQKDAIRCTCSHGRQRYLDQAELFLKNGLIDKAEYSAMKEHYLTMELPDDI